MDAKWSNSFQSFRSAERGRIEIICGCMFAGKTARLIQCLRAAQTNGRPVAAFKHVLDNRYDAHHLITHDGQSFAARPVETATDIVDHARAAGVIGIDEGQFFSEPLADVCRQLAADGRMVIVAGIDNDAWGRPFPPFPRLKRIADQVEILHMPCGMCRRPAHYSQRMTPILNGQMVGGPEAYQPRCADCFQPLPPPMPAFA